MTTEFVPLSVSSGTTDGRKAARRDRESGKPFLTGTALFNKAWQLAFKWATNEWQEEAYATVWMDAYADESGLPRWELGLDR